MRGTTSSPALDASSRRSRSDAGPAVVLLTEVERGACRPRAVLFKHFCDEHGFRSRLIMVKLPLLLNPFQRVAMSLCSVSLEGPLTFASRNMDASSSCHFVCAARAISEDSALENAGLVLLSPILGFLIWQSLFAGFPDGGLAPIAAGRCEA
jgi:hypothetical protein